MICKSKPRVTLSLRDQNQTQLFIKKNCVICQKDGGKLRKVEFTDGKENV